MGKKADFPSLDQEALLWSGRGAFVFGVDEAGRGCLAGPVCAAVSCWAPFSPALGMPAPVRDSKMMTHLQREAAFGPVRATTLAHGVGFATSREIDRWNILRANHLAVARALEAAFRMGIEKRAWRAEELGETAFVFLSDGSHPLVSHAKFFVGIAEYQPEFPLLGRIFRRLVRETCVVKGDSKIFSIAGASVLAKVSRDRYMEKLHEKYPAYGFAAHKGYSTEAHIERLREVGPCPEHRFSFAPVSEVAKLFP